jgi:phasin family protein
MIGNTMLNFEQIAANQKSAVAGLFGLTHSLFDSAQALVKLNLQAAKTTLQETEEAALTAASIKDPKELGELATKMMKAAPEKAASYLRHVQAIATTSSTEVRTFVETATSGAKAELATLVEAAVKNAPAGSENAVALVKSAVAAATTAFENAQASAKEATDKAVEAVAAQLEAKA